MKSDIRNKIRSNLLLDIDKEIKSNQKLKFFKLNDQTIKESIQVEFNEIYTCQQDVCSINNLSLSITDTISESSITNSVISYNNTQATSPFNIIRFSAFDKQDSVKQNLFILKSFCISIKSPHPLNKNNAKRRNEPSKTNKVNSSLHLQFKENIKNRHRGSVTYVNHQNLLTKNSMK